MISVSVVVRSLVAVQCSKLVMKFASVLVLFAFALTASASENTYENMGLRLAMKIYDDCSNADGFSACLKKKAITVVDRLGRMEKFPLFEGVTIVRAPDTIANEPAISEEQLENTLPRAIDAKEEALNDMLLNKVTSFIGSRTLQVTVPKLSIDDFGIEEGRGKKGGGKKGGMMGGLMMGIAAKMAALVPIAIAGLFLLAGKALITAKIALLLTGIIALKKLFASKNKETHAHTGWSSSGGGGGWQSGGGGWDKRSLDEAQKLAYNAYNPK